MNNSPIEYFPLSVATGNAFCNRVEEKKRLMTCIAHQRPLLVVSPRRYGKTSLVLRVIEEMQLPYAHIDLFSVIDEDDLERVVLQGVGRLISSIEPIPDKALKLAKTFFNSLNIRAVLSHLGVSIELDKKKEKAAYHLLDILERLESLTQKIDKKIILFFDEFQCIADIATDHAMESVLRQVAQLTKSISFIFSGSHRHLLEQLFDDRNRPFYKLCEKVSVERISEKSYIEHIQKIAKITWNQHLPDRILSAIFAYTECHPYYVNLVCSRLFLLNFPDNETVSQLWSQYLLEERSGVASELELLSKNQRKLLTAISRYNGTNAPLGKEFIHKANISKATIEQSLSFLEKKDYVYRDKNGFIQALDPLMKSVLSDLG